MSNLLRYTFTLMVVSLWGIVVGAVGVPVTFHLPTDAPLPHTYRVTLAIVDKDNPDWIISQFVSGAVRTVTAENNGAFTESWDGLDDNFMPVPPGTYAVKGIYMPAEKWQVDGEYHSVTPLFNSGVSGWLPTPEQWNKPEPFGGDPVGSPLGDIDVGLNGVGVFYYSYLENGLNNPMFDLKKPINYEQFLRAFGSGGAAGGSSTCTDGDTVWSFSTDGGAKYVFRADGRPFGTGRAQRPNVYLPTGWVESMAALRDTAAKKTYVYIAEGGKIVKSSWDYSPSTTEFVDKITILAGEDGKQLGELPVRHPRAIVTRFGVLDVLHATDNGFAVSEVALEAGLPKGDLKVLFALPAAVTPADLEVDSHGRIYVSDTTSNKVYQYDRTGKLLVTFGKLAQQQPGSYDNLSFIIPTKLATWTDADGADRLIVIEAGGPNRASEWSADGKLVREYPTLQTKANDGYAIDPEHPENVYVTGQRGYLTRFKVDYAKGTWTVNAVWPDVGTDPTLPALDHPKFINLGGRQYIAGGRSYNIYRREGVRWVLSAGIIRKQENNQSLFFSWHDANGDGKVQEEEYRNSPLTMPGYLMGYHGAQWNDELSLVSLNMAGADVWRLTPTGFDVHGNPIFTKWEKLLTDSVFTSRIAGTADAIHGGNELDTKFSSDWSMVDGSTQEGYYVNARGGPSFSANEGGQVKISYYAPDGKGGYTLKWRTGRTALQGTAANGEIYATIHINKPINGLLSVVDQSRCGVLLYNEDGLYVDSIFPDGRRFSPAVAGVYPQPGEFFAGYTYANKDNGKIYFAMGKYTTMIFEAKGWSLKENPVHRLTNLQPTVVLSATQIATPPEIALTMRGGAGAAHIARFVPALGGAVLDGSMSGWESTAPITFQADKDQTMEVRTLYDPDNLYLRWHLRTATPVAPKALQPIERIFTHDRLADTMSFYIQGDTNAKAPDSANGRPGDVRFVFGVFKDGDTTSPVALGMYNEWKGNNANPITYRTPVGAVTYAHVGPVAGAKLQYVMDADGKGYVLTAALPRTAIPGLPTFSGDSRTMVDFEATFNGHSKVWWSNADGKASRETYDEPTEARLYPGSWAPAQWQSLADGVLVRNWLIIGPFGGAGAEKFMYDMQGPMPGTNIDYKQAGSAFAEAQKYPPDDAVDVNAVYKGKMIEGYWNNPGEVRWHQATIADLDNRVVLSGAAQTWYGVTWVYAPEDTEVEFQIHGHPQTYLRFYLNELMLTGPNTAIESMNKKVTLRKGWNQVKFRGYCVGYSPFRAGLTIAAAPEKLWTLRLSTTPPAANK